MKTKYITPRQLLFTKCELQFKCTLQDLGMITKKFKMNSPTFNIFNINDENAYILTTMECSFINKATEDGLKKMEEEIDELIAYLETTTLEVFQINFSHKIDEDYISF